MSDGLIPRRYAKALYKYAVEKGDAQEIYELLKGLSFRYTAIDELKRAVLNPEISDEAKGAYMLKLAGGMGHGQGDIGSGGEEVLAAEMRDVVRV